MKKLFLLFFLFPLNFAHANSTPIAQSEVDALMSNTAIEGSTGATITLIEYSDMECPFCIRLHNDIQLWKKVHAKYGDRVNYVFKNNRWVNHANTEKKALTAICVKKLSGNTSYIRFYNQVLEWSTNNVLYPLSRITTFLRKEKISLLRYNRCMKDSRTLLQLDKETQEAQKYDLGGTPGVIIINHKTLTYDTVLGAYPIESFEEKIDALLK
jgi:protein-disulfide isomerase